MAKRELPQPPQDPSPLYRPNRRKANAGHIEEQRDGLIQDLYDAETEYNTLLHATVKYYATPLQTYQIITENQHKILFNGLQSIQQISDEFLSAFTQRKQPSNWSSTSSKISDLLQTFIPLFALYQTHLSNYQLAWDLLEQLSSNKKWIIFSQKAHTHCQSLSLSDLLLLPAEQIVKYRYILSEIIKRTNPTHADYVCLKSTLESFSNETQKMKEAINEYDRMGNIRKIERKFKGHIDLLQAHRAFICEGKLWKISARTKKDRLYQFFLFNDLLIYASSFGNKYKIHNMLPINDKFNVDMLKPDASYGSDKNGRIFSIESEIKWIVVYAESNAIAQEWVRQLKNLCAVKRNISHAKIISLVPRKFAICDTDAESLPIWIPDTNVTHCSIKSCNTKFSFTNRKHHCRKCGAVICGKCSKYKISNSEGVAQRACKTCFILRTEIPKIVSPDIGHKYAYAIQQSDGDGSDDSDASDFENEIQCLYLLPYYIETADYQSIFDTFGDGVGSFMLVPSSMDCDEYYYVNLVVETKDGFESFKVSLLEKKHMVFRLQNQGIKTKDFDGMDSLLRYLENEFEIKCSYPILRTDVETARDHSIKNFSVASLGYPKAQALYDYESKVDGDLTFKAGDVVCVCDTNDSSGWWKGFIADRVGIFPSNYVQLVEDIDEKSYIDNDVIDAINTMKKESSSATIAGEGRRRNDGTVIEHCNSEFDNVVLGVIDDLDEKSNTLYVDEDDLEDVHTECATRQFYNFLKRNGLEKYYEKFKENECCNIRDCEYLLDEVDFIKEDIGIKNPIHRKKLLGELAKLKYRMDEFKSSMNIIPELMVLKLLDFGIVTMDILCSEVTNKSDLRNKLKINNHHQCNLLWNIIEMQINPRPNYKRISCKSQHNEDMEMKMSVIPQTPKEIKDPASLSDVSSTIQ